MSLIIRLIINHRLLSSFNIFKINKFKDCHKQMVKKVCNSFCNDYQISVELVESKINFKLHCATKRKTYKRQMTVSEFQSSKQGSEKSTFDSPLTIYDAIEQSLSEHNFEIMDNGNIQLAVKICGKFRLILITAIQQPFQQNTSKRADPASCEGSRQNMRDASSIKQQKQESQSMQIRLITQMKQEINKQKREKQQIKLQFSLTQQQNCKQIIRLRSQIEQLYNDKLKQAKQYVNDINRLQSQLQKRIANQNIAIYVSQQPYAFCRKCDTYTVQRFEYKTSAKTIIWCIASYLILNFCCFLPLLLDFCKQKTVVCVYCGTVKQERLN